MYSRTHPFLSRIKERYLLTGPSSTKKTYHIALDNHESTLRYKVGDSIATLPSNDPDEVDHILHKIGASGREEVFDVRNSLHLSIRDFLLTKANLARVNKAFLNTLSENGASLDPSLQDKAKQTAFLHEHTLLDVLSLYPTASSADLAKYLMPLMPRFYSIANSAKVFQNEIHLTVAYVHYLINGQLRRGVGSHFLCDLAEVDKTPISIYLQPSHHFTLPSDPNASIILVGPGTGIAPFRAFLQERLAEQAQGRNWVIFGERNRASDFYYETFWTDLERQGRIRLDLAFSRDQPQKIYVQHKMYEHKKTLWHWLQEGAYFYVCGNAEEMAKDVDAMLQKIAQEEGPMTSEAALHYVKQLRAEKRYLADVY